MLKIYHNQNCSKSRSALELIQTKGEEIVVKSYLEEIPTKEEIKDIIQMLGIKAIELIRKNESMFKEKLAQIQAEDDDIWIDIMMQYPILIERPIIIRDNKAVIGRPIERVYDLF